MFSIDISGHWSNLSMVFFIILGLYCVWTVNKMKECESVLIRKNGNPYNYMIMLVLFFAFFAAFRLIFRNEVTNIGGTDAFSYKYMFEHANDSFYQKDNWFLHNDFLFRYFVKVLRYIFSEYRVYFFIIYGFNTLSWMLFLKEFCIKKSNYLPCILVTFLYWVSFNTLRSTVAYSVFALALILLYRKKTKWAVLVAVSTIFIHKMAAVFCLLFPFYYIINHIRLTRLRIILLIASVIIASSSIQMLFVGLTEGVDLRGSYHTYVYRQVGVSFWENSWKITFEQMILGLAMWLFYKRIQRYKLSLRRKEKDKLQFIWTICLFDMMCIPVNSVLGAWRGYEFLYLARIVMWCTIIYLFENIQSAYSKKVINVFVMVVLIAWIIFRFWNMWESGGLMPYIFEPLLYVSTS